MERIRRRVRQAWDYGRLVVLPALVFAVMVVAAASYRVGRWAWKRTDWRRVRDAGFVVAPAVVVAGLGQAFPHYFPGEAESNAADRWIGWINGPTFAVSVLLLLLRTRSGDWTWLTRSATWVFTGLVCLYLLVLAPHEGWATFLSPNWIWQLRFLLGFGGVTFALALIAGEVQGFRRRRRIRLGFPVDLTPDVVLAAIVAAKPIIIANDRGVILYATGSISTLVHGPIDEIQGANLTAIMPKRYRAVHLRGIERYRRTGEGRVMGRVVSVSLLRMDVPEDHPDAEVPIYLTISHADVGDHRYFVGSLWERGAEIVLP